MKRRFLALAFALALVAVACGSDDGAVVSSSEPTTTTTMQATTTTTTLAAETTTTAAEPDPIDVGDPANWPLEAPELALPVTFTDGAGNEVTVTTVDRIGSMYGGASEVLWTLGLGDNIVVIEGTTQYPADLAALPNVGFFRALPAEGILAQTPDVLFVSVDAGPPEVLESIEAAGVVVVRVPIGGPEPGALRDLIELLGIAVGAPEHATALADSLMDAYAAIALEPAADAPVVLYGVARGQNVYLTGLDSPSNTFIAAAGFTSAAAALGLEGAAPLTPEALIVANPSVIITTRSSVQQAGGEAAFLAMPGVAESPAGQNGALLVWEDDSEIQQWTPRVVTMLVELKSRLDELVG